MEKQVLGQADSYTYNSRYFTSSLPVILLRVTVNAKFLNFKLGKKKWKEEVVVRNKTSDIGDKQIVICGQLRDTYFSFIGALALMNCNSYCITAEEK